jgi:hypothetical protein
MGGGKVPARTAAKAVSFHFSTTLGPGPIAQPAKLSVPPREPSKKERRETVGKRGIVNSASIKKDPN